MLVLKRPHGFISQSCPFVLRWNQEATAVKLREKGEAAQEVTLNLAAAKEINTALAWTLVSTIIRMEVYFKLLCLALHPDGRLKATRYGVQVRTKG